MLWVSPTYPIIIASVFDELGNPKRQSNYLTTGALNVISAKLPQRLAFMVQEMSEFNCAQVQQCC